MGINGNTFSGNYLESIPLNKIAKFPEGPPRNGVPFTGYPQQHRTEKNKIILVYDPLGKEPSILEFKLDDILYVEEVPQAVTEKGEGIPMVKLWIRRGARGMLLEPFEVEESLHFLKVRGDQKEKFSNRKPERGKSKNSSVHHGRL